MFPAALPAALPRASVLLVEDDIEARHALAQRLRMAGFVVAEASNAGEAVDLFHAADAFDAVLTDLEMPGEMNGFALAEHIRTRSPGLQVIVMSGKEVSREAAQRKLAFFPKPIAFDALVEALEMRQP